MSVLRRSAAALIPFLLFLTCALRVQAQPVGEAAGSPLSGASVSLESAAGTLVLNSLSGRDGSFEFKNLPPGAYLLRVRCGSEALPAASAVSRYLGTQSGRLSSGEPRYLSLRLGGVKGGKSDLRLTGDKLAKGAAVKLVVDRQGRLAGRLLVQR